MAFLSVKISGQSIEVDSAVEEVTFKELHLTEAHLEEFIRKNIGELFDADGSLLIVGQQVVDQERSRSDLVAIDGDGCLVLIEIKRDLADIKCRSETLESQAIRYAASLAKINSPKDLVNKMFASYINKHRDEEPFKSKLGALSEFELATRELNNFLKQNKIDGNFNKKQRIILVSSEFDNITLSSSAWLIRNGVDLSCYEMRPLRVKDNYMIDLARTLPVEEDEDFFVDIYAYPEEVIGLGEAETMRKRRSLPRMSKLFEWGLLKSGDHLEIKNFDDSDATIIDQKFVEYKGQKVSFNDWGQSVTGWSTIGIYDWAVLKSKGKTLHALRTEKMQEIDKQANS